MNVTNLVAEELYALGFTFKHYQENFYKGEVYYYNDAEWVIGGRTDEDIFSDFDLTIMKNGLWLPSESHLIEWLQDNDFVFAIINNDGFFEIQCKDIVTLTEYNTKTPTLEYSLAALIKKILKKREREFDVKNKIFGIIKNQ